MNNRKKLYEIPVPSTSFVVEAYWDAGHHPNAIRYAYEDEETSMMHFCGIGFKRAVYLQKRSEGLCIVWHLKECYDTLIEIENSSLIEELSREVPGREHYLDKMHHYLIYLDSVGSFEIIAESWELLPEEIKA
jgi:hypothetical protein